MGGRRSGAGGADHRRHLQFQLAAALRDRLHVLGAFGADVRPGLAGRALDRPLVG